MYQAHPPARMEAILLAGGLGTRIRPLTYTRPKPLLPIANRTLLERSLEQMPKAVSRIILPVNYLGELIRAHLEEHPDPRLLVVDEPEPLGTGGAIKNVENHLTGPFLVYNADIVSSVDLAKLIEYHDAKKARATVSLWDVDEPWHFGVVDLGGDGRIRRFVEKPPRGQEPSRLINAGHYVLELDVLDELEAGEAASLEREVFESMARRGGIYGFPFTGYWVDCGRPETFLEANRVVLAQAGRSIEVGARVEGASRARLDSFAVGDGCRFEPGAVVERSVLFGGVRLARDVRVVDSILGEGVEVDAGTTMERCVVGDFAPVEGGRRIRDQRIGMRPEHLTEATG